MHIAFLCRPQARGCILLLQVQGLGPLFKLKLTVKNTGAKAVSDLPLTFSYNKDFYRVKSSLTTVRGVCLPVAV